MGFAVAQAAAMKGHEAILVSGPVALKTPKGVRRIDVTSAREMASAVKEALKGAAPTDAFIATAAVADWRPKKCAGNKLKKSSWDGVVRLVRNPDILKGVKGVRKVGFAAETDRVLEEAKRKCKAKKLEFIVANDVREKGAGFGSDTNRVTFLRADGSIERLPLMTKLAVAKRIIRELEAKA